MLSPRLGFISIIQVTFVLIYQCNDINPYVKIIAEHVFLPIKNSLDLENVYYTGV